jgi:hypothetical protein
MPKIKSALLLIAVFFLATSGPSLAQQGSITAAISKAYKQAMLSQRIAKAYFFMRNDIQATKARAQLEESLVLFVKQHDKFTSEIKDKELQELFTFIEINLADYANLVNRGYNKNRAKQVLILSETIQEVYQSVVDKLEQTSKQKNAKLVKLSGRELMLSQRMAKLYIAYHAGLQDIKSVEQFNKTVSEFETTLGVLIASDRNTPEITSALVRIKSLWSILRKFLNLENLPLPVTVLITTDKILEEMNAVTQMYMQKEL